MAPATGVAIADDGGYAVGSSPPSAMAKRTAAPIAAPI